MLITAHPSQAPRIPCTAIACMAALLVSIGSMFGLSNEIFMLDSKAFWSQPWTLVTTILPHGDALHLFFNVFWMWTLGGAVEAIFRRRLWICLVLCAAVASSASEFAFSGTPIGLSGVVYALFTFLWVASRRIPGLRGLIDPGTVKLFIAWFFVCIVLSQLDVMRIANIAHGVGAAVGAILALAVTTAGWRRSLSLLGSASLIGLSMQAASGMYVLMGRESPLLEERINAAAFGHEDLEQAAAEMRGLLQEFPESVYVQYSLVEIYAAQSKIKEASDLLESLESMPLTQEWKENVASAAVDCGWATTEPSPLDLASFARRAHRLDPDSFKPWLLLSTHFSDQGAEVLARMCYQTAAQLQPPGGDLNFEQYCRTRPNP
jgi:GlpG protein